MNIDAIKALELLLAENSINRSKFSIKQQQYLNRLAKQTNIISCNKQGRGFVYQVINSNALQVYLKQLQPLNHNELDDDVPQRSRNIGVYKDSKQGKTEHDVYYLLMKAVVDAVYWFNDTHKIDVSLQTKIQGASCLLITVHDNWQSNSPLFLIENQALFNRLDWLPINFKGSVIYYNGNLTTLLLNWLSYKKRASEFILFADYDGVGFNNFFKLCLAVGNTENCHFYLMPRWKEKLNLFGNHIIWQDNLTRFHNAANALNNMNALNDELMNLIILMQSLGKGLEQEAIWL